MAKKCDFGGWATRYGVKCSDGLIINKDAFKHCDGKQVPLIWGHIHDDPARVLGHAILENRPEGVYAYCTLNHSDSAKAAKILLDNGDVSSLSVFANHLSKNKNLVCHGDLKEVSIVLSGANPEALITDMSLHHSDDDDDFAVFVPDRAICLYHSDDNDDNDPEPNLNNSNNKGDNNMDPNNDDRTVQDVLDGMTEEQRNVVYGLVGTILERYGINPEDINNEGDNGNMAHHNIFEPGNGDDQLVLSHDDMKAIFDDAKRNGSLRDLIMEHGDDYGITNIDYLFPEAKVISETPDFISRDMDWVQKVMSSVHHSPFARIKSVHANITEDEARAKGYIKGNRKKNEVFTLLKRVTTPTTVYKHQQLDRDDVIDIVDFDVVMWLKHEMRLMLDEEIAGALLIGDGRLSSSDDKINEQNIRPIWSDDDLYCIKKTVTYDVSDNMSEEDVDDAKAKKFIRAVKKARKDYKGSGNPALYTTEDMITACLLLEDGIGRTMYDTIEKLATALRVSEIIPVPVMERLTDTENGTEAGGLMVNLKDYTVGADKGGAVNLFDDFDIDYNQQKYLIETRCSGALTKPLSAIAFTMKKNSVTA